MKRAEFRIEVAAVFCPYCGEQIPCPGGELSGAWEPGSYAEHPGTATCPDCGRKVRLPNVVSERWKRK